ncbi:HAD family phosphatase [Aeromicrobium alkaliterrae]|uniref:HAD family hydrolase n=1 Tax=Aeromicrobium alkaliterrae TaxID=302168 RepID=UPI0031D55B68
MGLPDAVLWDLDGTLVDTEPLWIAAEHELADLVGGSWSEADALQLVGSDLLTSGRILQQHFGTSMTPEEIVDFLVVRVSRGLAEGAPWRPGAPELVRAFADRGVPQALVTMSYAVMADPLAELLPLAAVVTGDRVSQGKPHPEPYLVAASTLGVDPAACIAVEDSETGATSATEAGCHVLAVPHMVPVAPHPRRRSVTTLEGLTPESVAALFA